MIGIIYSSEHKTDVVTEYTAKSIEREPHTHTQIRKTVIPVRTVSRTTKKCGIARARAHSEIARLFGDAKRLYDISTLCTSV